MRYAALAIIFLSLPIFIAVLRGAAVSRGKAVAALTFMLFLAGSIRVDTFLIDWPYWQGTVKGIGVSPVDTLALALILTRQRRAGGFPFSPLVATYGLMLLFSIMFATTPMASTFSVWQLGRVFLLFVAIVGECHAGSSLRGVVNGLSLGLMLQAAIVIWQKFGGMVQANGTLPHQNILGMMVELAILPLLAFLFAGGRSRLVSFGIFAALIIVAGGGSRGAVAFTAGGIGIYCILSLMRNVTPRKMKIIGAGLIALLIVSPIGLKTMTKRLRGGPLVTAETERESYKNAARSIAADHPFGVGANMFVLTANIGGYAERAGVSWNFANRSAPVHHGYLLARAETGWAGELALIMLLLVPAGSGLLLAFKRRSDGIGEVSLGSAIAIGVNVVHNNFEYAVHTYPVQALLFVNIALISWQRREWLLGSQVRKSRPRPTPPLEDSSMVRPSAS